MKKLGLILFLGVSLVQVSAAKKTPHFVDWDNPVPRFSELNLDLNELSRIIDDGLLIVTLPRQNLKLWSQGELKDFEGVRIAATATVMDVPVDVIKRQIKRVAEMDDYMPQISDAQVIANQGEDFIAQFIQSYKLPFITIKAEFHLQHTMEENGDISVLLHEGDIDTGVARWEFFPLDGGKRTLVVYSYWGDLKSAGLAFKFLLNSQPELEVSMIPIASAMVLMQLKDRVEKSSKINMISNEGLPLRPKIPLYSSGALPVATLEKLMATGTVTFVHPKQWIQGEDNPHGILFASGLNAIPESVEKVLPLSSDYQRLGEYFNWLKDVDIEKKGKVEAMTLWLKVKVGPVSIGITNKMLSTWDDAKRVMTFQDTGGDLAPMYGAWEFIPIDDDKETIMVFTSAGLVSDEAGWMMKMMRSIPLYELIFALHGVITILEKQEPWLYRELEIPPKAHHIITPAT